MTEALHTVTLALGTNLGHRAANLRAALASLPPQVIVRRVSRVYETQPWGFTEQPAFLNQVIEAQTMLNPRELLRFLKQREQSLGRQPTFRYGPRMIDLDILFYDDLVTPLGDPAMERDALVIPHPRMAERAFVLAPLADLQPERLHPHLHQTIRALLAALDLTGVQPVMDDLPAFGLRTYIMGIINVTPDSFSGDGVLQAVDPLDAALRQAEQFIADGADILDIGGESTRPGAPVVSEAEEMARVLPVLRGLAEALRQPSFSANRRIFLSVDTYKAAVAEAALQAGADWVNDVWALRADARMAEVLAAAQKPVILMHNRLTPTSAALQARLSDGKFGLGYTDLLGEIQEELLEAVRLAQAAGIREENILLDPGVGFGKSVEQNLELINRLGEICALGFPVLLGPSRKSFIGRTLDLPADQRLEGTAAAAAVGIARGADILRVHDVAFMARVARMTDALVRRGPTGL